jgi:hypothetical protein
MDNDNFNLRLAVCLLVNALMLLAQPAGHPPYLNSEVIHDLYYTFRCRDVSKEALMAVAKTLLA